MYLHAIQFMNGILIPILTSGLAKRQLSLHGDQQHGVHLRRAHPPRAGVKHFLLGMDHVGKCYAVTKNGTCKAAFFMIESFDSPFEPLPLPSQ